MPPIVQLARAIVQQFRERELSANNPEAETSNPELVLSNQIAIVVAVVVARAGLE
jgi:hypothetical protein